MRKYQPVFDLFSQKPVFIPGPAHRPEELRRTCDMPTVDHRSSLFAEMLQPALQGVRKTLGSDIAEILTADKSHAIKAVLASHNKHEWGVDIAIKHS